MKTIFDVLDHNQKDVDAEKLLPIYRIHYNDGVHHLNKIALSTSHPVSNGKYILLPKNHAVLITFMEKEPGVISTRKTKPMEMSVSMVIRDTWLPQDGVLKIEELSSAPDISDVIQTLAGLRKNIEEAGAEKSPLILPE